MNPTILLIVILLSTISCNLADRKGQERNATQFSIESVYSFDPALSKSSTDTFKYDRTAMLKKYPFEYFKDNNGYCKLENDTLKVFFRDGYLTSTSLNLLLTKNAFNADVWVYDCTSRTNYKAISQKLILNRKTFLTGDTLIGEFNFVGLPYFESKFSGTDTLTTKGKFKLLIRPSTFTFDVLNEENNYNDFLALAKERPDTIKEVNLWKCGLTNIPKEILLFKNLESLSLEANDLGKADFTILNHLSKLKKLKLQECRLTTIPASVLNLQHLEEFDIYLNDIAEIPEEFYKLSNLKALQIGGNKFKSLSPLIAKLTKLEWIEFSGTQIRKLPDEMTRLKCLKEIYPNDTMVYIPDKLKALLASSCNFVTVK